MKYYLVERKTNPNRWFDNQKDLTEFLINVIVDEEVNILTIDGDVESVSSKQFLNGIKDEVRREGTLNVVFGDDYSQKVEILISKFKELAKRMPNDKTKLSPNSQKALDKLSICERNKEDFSKLVKSLKNFLLYNVSDSVEWYSILLDVYPFRKLDETCLTEVIDKNTFGIKWNGHRTPDKMITNFEKAKLKIKKPLKS